MADRSVTNLHDIGSERERRIARAGLLRVWREFDLMRIGPPYREPWDIPALSE